MSASESLSAELNHVFVSYDRWGVHTSVLCDVSLVLPAQGWITIGGANGSGKSTLLKVLAGTLRPNHGTVRLFGQDPAALSARRRRGLVMYCRQDPREGTAATLTVREHAVAAGYRWTRFVAALRAIDKAQAFAFIEQAGPQPIEALSGGQRQLMALALRLLSPARILLLDEPVSALDPDRAAAMDAVFRALATSRLIIEVTHDRTAATRGDEFLWIQQGVLTKNGRGAGGNGAD